MSDEIYNTPNASLADVLDEAELLEFYVVARKKFTCLFFSTMGIYAIYWFYRNWKLQKQKHRLSIWPVARGIFNIFFAHSLFEKINLVLEERNPAFCWSPSILATLYVVFQVLSGVLERLSMNEMGSPFTDLAGIAVLIFIYYPLIRAQEAINIAVGDPRGRSNATFSAANIIWLILGTIMWLLVLVGIGIVLGLIPE